MLYPQLKTAHLESLRSLLLSYSCKQLCKEFVCYLKVTYPSCWSGSLPHSRGELTDTYAEFLQDLTTGCQALKSYTASNYMTWDGGSTLIFWRWPKHSKLTARDGLPPYQLRPYPSNTTKLRFSSQQSKKQVLEKLLICLQKNYLILTPPDKVQNYIDYFPVP